jgi:pimeloyl-ACP methyl ester carboxylesterase
MMKLVTTLTQSNAQHPPLVLVHGLGSAATAFKPIIPALAQSFRVITVDLPGHGQTPLDPSQAMDPHSLGQAVFDTIESQYGIREFHIAGNSLGGWIGLEMASDQPDRIKTLIGIAPAGLWLEPASGRVPSEARSYYMAKVLKPFVKAGLHLKALRKIGYSTVSPKWQQLSYEICYDAANAMGNAPGYFPAWDGMLGRRFEGFVPESIPVMILFGDTDNTLPYPESQERSLAPAHCTWLVINQCGHAPMWDQPDLIVKLIKETTAR